MWDHRDEDEDEDDDEDDELLGGGRSPLAGHNIIYPLSGPFSKILS